jgi:hypothetical protein
MRVRRISLRSAWFHNVVLQQYALLNLILSPHSFSLSFAFRELQETGMLVAVHNMADSFMSSSYIRKECIVNRIRMLLRPTCALYSSLFMILAQE